MPDKIDELKLFNTKEELIFHFLNMNFHTKNLNISTSIGCYTLNLVKGGKNKIIHEIVMQ